MTGGEIGRFALLLAFSLVTFQLAAGGLGAARRIPELGVAARNASIAVAAVVGLAGLALLYALLSRDFSLRYVAETSSRSMPLDVVWTSFWGGQPGSLLFWTVVLSGLSALAAWRTAARLPDLAPYLAAVLGAVLWFFVFLLAFVSSPFEALPVPASDGRGLNPLLWDDGMRIHPPLLLAGYASFAIPFAFAVAALISGRLGRDWLAATRGWMLVAWTVQGAGLLVGSWWAYHVLGWGGYWGWDPVENAALMPWLLATAYIHSSMVTERRGLFQVWTLALVIGAFALAIFGTFIVRSGALSSVHAFATSAIGPFFFGFLGLILIGSVGLVFYRLPLFKSDAGVESLTSRETGLLVNNWLLGSVAAATFWGTVFPLISELVRGAKIAVGAPFYNSVNGPLLLALLVLMAAGPLLAWRRTYLPGLWRRLRWPLAAAGATTLTLLLLGMRQGLAALAFGVCALVAASAAVEFWRGARARQANTQEPFPVALFNLVSRARRRYGGYLVHLAVVLAAVGVIASQFFKVETAATLRPNESVSLGGYTLVYQGTSQQQGPGYQAVVSRLSLLENETRPIAVLEPTRRVHENWESQPTTGVAIHTTWPGLQDVYVVLSNWNEDGSATFRVFVEPLVSLLWAAGVLFVLGTLVAAWPERVRQPAARPAPAREAVFSEA